MAQSVHLFLKAAGADLQGESTQTSNGRANSIECSFFEHACDTAREAGSGNATGRRQYRPIVVRKDIDKTTPLIMKALRMNQNVSGIFKFYRPDTGTNPEEPGSGEDTMFYSIEFTGGRISHTKQYVRDTHAIDVRAANDLNAHSAAPQEEVGFVFHTIKWIYTAGGIEDQDSWTTA